MKIIATRRIAQVFFLLLFFWFCWVTTLGERWWQLGGWPVNWLLQLDPLVGMATLLATRTLYAGLLWGLVTVVLTLLLGRFFCGWICPFGTMQQAFGYLSLRKKTLSKKINANCYRPAQKVKYGLLTFLLAAAAADLVPHFLRMSVGRPASFFLLAAAAGVIVFGFSRIGAVQSRTGLLVGFFLVAGFSAAAFFPAADPWIYAASLQTGFFDPIPLAHRGVNLTVMPLVRGELPGAAAEIRGYVGAWLVGLFFWGGLLLCLWIPRFYCRMICPLGALFGLLGRGALWRIGKKEAKCRSCLRCESHCEGACQPSKEIRISECVLCLNCLDRCRTGNIGYRIEPSAAGEVRSCDLSRRAFASALAAGLVSVPVLRLSGHTSANWPAGLVRPPGALDEDRFLRRCIKCGQCMRICPTNVIQPAIGQAGLEGIWTPVLNFRIGSSGCQLNCVACGHVCPTAAIRGLSLDEKLGRGAFYDRGPVKIGTAFVDRGRCLPWAMDRPCIVCQENCPVSPKAILVDEVFRPVEGGLTVKRSGENVVDVDLPAAASDRPYGSGDYFCLQEDGPPKRIVSVDAGRVTMASEDSWDLPPVPGDAVTIAIRLQQPRVDPARCIGCGICEHECPIQGSRAIYVTAENESRAPAHALLVGERQN